MLVHAIIEHTENSVHGASAGAERVGGSSRQRYLVEHISRGVTSNVGNSGIGSSDGGSARQGAGNTREHRRAAVGHGKRGSSRRNGGHSDGEVTIGLGPGLARRQNGDKLCLTTGGNLVLNVHLVRVGGRLKTVISVSVAERNKVAAELAADGADGNDGVG